MDRALHREGSKKKKQMTFRNSSPVNTVMLIDYFAFMKEVPDHASKLFSDHK